MSDTISRQAAIETAKKMYVACDTNSIDDYEMLMEEALNVLPSAEPKRGKWIQDRSGAYCCSKCMEPCATYVMMKPRDKICKMCGSRNEVTE